MEIKKYDSNQFLRPIIVFFFLFNGCSSYYEILKQDPIKDSTMRFTKKGEIINSLETKGVLVATHLNRVDSNYNDGEYYIIERRQT